MTLQGTQISLDSLMITKQILLRWFFWVILLGFKLLGEAGPRSTQMHSTYLFVKFRFPSTHTHKKNCPEKLGKNIWSTNSNVNFEMHFVWNKSLTSLKEQFTQKWKLPSDLVTLMLFWTHSTFNLILDCCWVKSFWIRQNQSERFIHRSNWFSLTEWH